ncbi:Uma2 family endonuclease [Pantanalinema sp. GBBB05]|uniref:Uma2 family endonuclease n=1 Tax=Pantanalinema sp. GBBB05 TaxID=2604139 RepID=UPI001D70B967|nr:Uma2 family endonuclease [Pantanalinema sp. GBBB05]
MFALVSAEKTHLPPGSVVRLPATWEEYQAVSQQRGDSSIPRLKYRHGELLLMSPLPQHGKDASLIADVIKTLLDHADREYDSFTPITMELPEESGIEPDYCFYIDHWEAVLGKRRINWRTDPPPDLALEIDITSYSDINDYLPYQVPEVWLFKREKLRIYQLQGNAYTLQTQSRYFPDIDLQGVVDRCLQIAYDRNTSAAIRDLRQRLRNNNHAH